MAAIVAVRAYQCGHDSRVYRLNRSREYAREVVRAVSLRGSDALSELAGRPPCQRPMAGVVRGFVEDRLPELVMAGVAHHSHVSHSPAALGRLPSRLTDAGRPAHLTLARPEPMTERAAFWLVLEQGSGHRS